MCVRVLVCVRQRERGVKGSREKGKMGVDASARECVIERVSEGGRV